MAFPTAVNAQITDSITQTNVEILSVAPAQAEAMLYTSLGQSLALAASNAVIQQQNANVLMDAVMAKAVARVLNSFSESRKEELAKSPGQSQ